MNFDLAKLEASSEVSYSAAAGSAWVYERHGDVVYSYGRHGAHTGEVRYRNALCGESSAGRKWIDETHGGVTYVGPR